MAFVKYVPESARSRRSKPVVEVRVGSRGIALTSAALERYSLADVDRVYLYWNEVTSEIGISTASDRSDPSAFRMAPRGKQGGKFIGAAAFYRRFGIDIADRSASDGELRERHGLITFRVDTGRAITRTPARDTPTTEIAPVRTEPTPAAAAAETAPKPSAWDLLLPLDNS